MKYILKENKKGGTSKYYTEVSTLIDNESLVFEFVCKNSKFYAPYFGYNENHFEGDVAEVFLSAGGDLENYYEIEVSPLGGVFFAKIRNRKNRLKITLLENTIETSARIQDNDYYVTIKVPLKSLGTDSADNFKFNAYRIETEGGKTEYLMAANPTMCSRFHRPQFFMELR